VEDDTCLCLFSICRKYVVGQSMESDRQQKEIAMAKKRRRKRDIEIDELTANDSLSDADVGSAEVAFPGKTKKIAINMRLEPDAVKLAKQLAAFKHLDGYTQLLRIYIWEGIERDRTMLDLLQRKNELMK